MNGAALRGDPALWHDLRSLLERTYDVAALEHATGVRPLSLLSVEQLADCRVQLEGEPSRTTTVELFLLGAGVEAARAVRDIEPLHRLVQAGLVELDGDVVRARVSILPFHGLWLVGDRRNERGAPPGQRVPNTDLSSLLIASVVSDAPRETMLDLGTGNGVQALLASRHCRSVVGVDINPRALMCARFNAGLNDVPDAEWIEGGFFDRLGDRTFDLVVANPPFILGPERSDVHRFGGGAGHELSREVVRGAAARLREAGRAYVLCDVGIGTGQTWTAPLQEWATDTGCDALLFRLASMSSASYALANNEATAYPSSKEYERASRAWLESYRSLGYSEIASVIVVLRRRATSQHWTRGFVLAGDPSGCVGGQVDRVLAGIDRFGDRPAEELLSERLTPVEGHELFQQLRRAASSYLPAEGRLAFPGFPLVGVLSPEGLPVLFALDGTRDLASVIAEVARDYGQPERDLRERLLPQLHDLAVRGFVT